ncbi:MAG: carbon dioxide concentrating mechanism protein [Cyanobacteria bacterium J06648_11]
MTVPSLQPISTPDRYHVTGEVVVHPSAIVAPGALLQAEAGARIDIGAGACIGMGAILHASNGTIAIGAGASIGAGVLIVGSSTVSPNACIGAVSTLWNASVPSGQLVAPGSVLEGEIILNGQPAAESSNTGPVASASVASASVSTPDGRVVAEAQTANVQVTQDEANANPSAPSSDRVIGRVQLNRLMVSLFPPGSPTQPSDSNPPPPPKKWDHR